MMKRIHLILSAVFGGIGFMIFGVLTLLALPYAESKWGAPQGVLTVIWAFGFLSFPALMVAVEPLRKWIENRKPAYREEPTYEE